MKSDMMNDMPLSISIYNDIRYGIALEYFKNIAKDSKKDSKVSKVPRLLDEGLADRKVYSKVVEVQYLLNTFVHTCNRIFDGEHVLSSQTIRDARKASIEIPWAGSPVSYNKRAVPGSAEC